MCGNDTSVALSIHLIFITTPTLPSTLIHGTQYVWASAAVTYTALVTAYSFFLVSNITFFSSFLSSFLPSFFQSFIVSSFSPFIYSFSLLSAFRHNSLIFSFVFFFPLIFFCLPLPPTLCLSFHLVLPAHNQFHMLYNTEGLLVTESVNRLQPTRPFLTETSFKKPLLTLTIFNTPTRLWAGDSGFFFSGRGKGFFTFSKWSRQDSCGAHTASYSTCSGGFYPV